MRPHHPKATCPPLLIPCHPVQELAQLKTRTALEVQAKEAEVTQLRQQLAQHEAARWGCSRRHTYCAGFLYCLPGITDHIVCGQVLYCTVLCYTARYCSFLVTDIRLGVDACPAPVLTPFCVCVPRHRCRQAAVAAAEAAAAAAAEEQLAAAVAAQEARVSELQSEVHRLRSSAQTYLRDEREVRRDATFFVFILPACSHLWLGGSHCTPFCLSRRARGSCWLEEVAVHVRLFLDRGV